jgi:hypothetical protein
MFARVTALALAILAVGGCEHEVATDLSDPSALPPFRAPSGPPRLVVHGRRACVVQRDATARCWDAGAAPARVEGEGILQVALGDARECRLLRGGKAECRKDGRVAPGLDGRADVIQLSSSGTRTCALMHDGSVSCWNGGDRPRPIKGMPPIREIATGAHHTCALAREGSVFCWGRGTNGALGDGADRDRASPVRAASVSGDIDLAVSHEASCALAANGAVICWGSGPNATGESGAGATPHVVTTVDAAMAIALGPDRMCVIRQGGSVSCGTPRAGLQPVEGLSLVEEVGLGEGSTCALAQGGAVSCWSSGSPPAPVRF